MALGVLERWGWAGCKLEGVIREAGFKNGNPCLCVSVLWEGQGPLLRTEWV